MQACLYTAEQASALPVQAPGSSCKKAWTGTNVWVYLLVLTIGCMLQPASARSKGQSRNSTDLGLLHGQESSTSGLDRMSSTQVGHTTALAHHLL